MKLVETCDSPYCKRLLLDSVTLNYSVLILAQKCHNIGSTFHNNRWDKNLFQKCRCQSKGALNMYRISSPTFFFQKSWDFVPLEVLAWVMTGYWVLCSILAYFWRNMNSYFNFFYFSKSTSINTLKTAAYGTLWRCCCAAVLKIAHKMKLHEQNQLQFQ